MKDSNFHQLLLLTRFIEITFVGILTFSSSFYRGPSSWWMMMVITDGRLRYTGAYNHPLQRRWRHSSPQQLADYCRWQTNAMALILKDSTYEYVEDHTGAPNHPLQRRWRQSSPQNPADHCRWQTNAIGANPKTLYVGLRRRAKDLSVQKWSAGTFLRKDYVMTFVKVITS